MNAVTSTVAKPTKLDQVRMEILPPEREREFYAGLPSHVKPERFMRNLDIALMQNPQLMQCDPRLIFREVSKAAALGLYLDPQLGEAYLIVGWNNKKKQSEPQLRIGYRGLIKLGRQSGEISQIYAHEVHANDVFKASLGDDKKLVHEPDIFGDRGPIVGYYAVVKYKDGDTDFEPLTIAQAHKIRDRSDGWKAFQAGKIKSTPWATDEEEMAKKTAIRRLTKRVPQSPELAEAIRIEDAAEHSGGTAIAAPTPPRPPMPPAPPRQQIEHAVDGEVTDVESEEIDEGETADGGEQGSEVERGTATDGEVADDQSTETDEDDPSAFFERLEEALLGVATEEDLEEAWNEFDVEATFDGDDVNQGIAKAIKKRAIKVLKEKAGGKD